MKSITWLIIGASLMITSMIISWYYSLKIASIVFIIGVPFVLVAFYKVNKE